MRRAKTPEFRTAQAAAATERNERRERLKMPFISGKQLVKRLSVHGEMIRGWWLIVDRCCPPGGF
jgi:hypothetical protein